MPPPPTSAPMSLLDQITAMSVGADAVAKDVEATNAELGKKVTRQRRKSRDLEQQVFGMHMTDVDALRKVFDEIDTDKSGSIEATELLAALKRAGKNPSNDQVKTLLSTYDADKNGNLSFDEFQKMIADWEKLFPSGEGAPASESK
jgi:hypothetical protein